MKALDWTQILITLITTLGGVASGLFARRSQKHATQAAISADRAVEASLRPGPQSRG
jgi:hypothetical protein